MVQAYRLLAAEQYKLGWDYPLHLGVTEAGEGEVRLTNILAIFSLSLEPYKSLFNCYPVLVIVFVVFHELN